MPTPGPRPDLTQRMKIKKFWKDRRISKVKNKQFSTLNKPLEFVNPLWFNKVVNANPMNAFGPTYRRDIVPNNDIKSTTN